MKIAVLKETAEGETRVSLVPSCIARLIKAGFEVSVEAGAGASSGNTDGEYEAKGATVVSDRATLLGAADVVTLVNAPQASGSDDGHEVDLMKSGAILFANLSALGGLEDETLLSQLKNREVTAFSLDCVPRITRAQSMDILSSQSNLAGYKAVLIAADLLDKILPMMMTAAGTISAAKVFVIGAGVAGLQAIATAKRLGAVVEAFDTRPAVKEQVRSLGAKFFEIDLGGSEGEDAGGYARQLSDEQKKKQSAAMGKRLEQSDIVITTALVPGRPAPVLISEETVTRMRRGAVIVDLAAERGGNCALTVPGEVVERHGVRIVGRLNLPATLAVDASNLFSRNVSTLILDLWRDGAFHLDASDEIVAGAMITRGGELVHGATKERLSKGDAG